MRVTDFTAFSLAQDALRVMFDPNPPYLSWGWWGGCVVIKRVQRADGSVKEIAVFRKWVGGANSDQYYRGCYVHITINSEPVGYLSFAQIRVDGGLNGNVSF